MLNNSQNTSNSRTIQYNNINNNIGMQQSQPRDKIQQSSLESEKRQKKNTQNAKRKPMEAERDRQKAEYEKQGNEFKNLLSQFGSRAKAADELDNDAKKLRSNIEALMAKAQAKMNKPIQPIQVTPPPPSPQPQPQPLAIEQKHQGFFTSILNNLVHIILFPLELIRLLFSSINWTIILFCILIIELMLIGFIWTVKRSQYNYLYVEPYEAVVHGTFGVDQSTSWGIVWSVVNSIRDFIAEVMYGGRGFGSSSYDSYDGFVPI